VRQRCGYFPYAFFLRTFFAADGKGNSMTFASCARSTGAALLLVALADVAHASLVTVTSLADAGAGSLRQAIALANAGDTIQFASVLSGAIVFGTPLALSKDVSIVGNGAIALDGNDATVVLQISSGTQVTLENLIVQRGRNVAGGGIYNAGHVTLSHCILRNNHAASGGALFVENLPGSGYVMGDTFVIDNEATGTGGGIYDAGQLDSGIARGEISGNRSLGSGAGICLVSRQTLTIDHTTIAGNQAMSTLSRGGGVALLGGGTISIGYSTVAANNANYGGGMYIEPGGTMNLSASLIDGNVADTDGGGISLLGGTLNALNSTFANNFAAEAGAGIFLVNAFTFDAMATLSSSTVAYNHSFTNGGGVSVLSGNLSLQYTLVAGNISPTDPDIQGAFTSFGLNLVQTRGTSSGYIASDLPGGSNPRLDDVASNGGPTDTINLLTASAAIGAIPVMTCAAIPLDQRGFRRLGGSCDIGAFQTGAIRDTLFADNFE
jgi:hypothetical protein